MLIYFPYAYPDELFYSQLSRYYTKSGHITYTFAAKEVFQEQVNRPEIEFINKLSSDLQSIIASSNSIKNVILENTMFPYYARFLPKRKKEIAFDLMCKMETEYKNYLSIPKNTNGRNQYLRYCPVCAKNDRQTYGETYWHRIHQMIGTNICPIHKCYLRNSSMSLYAKISPKFYDAETHIAYNEIPQYCYNNLECQFAVYMMNVLNEKIDLNSEIQIGTYLHYCLSGTKYLSVRGYKRNISALQSDFCSYYKSLENNWITESWQLQKIFTNNKTNFYDICLLSMFLKISPQEITHPTLPSEPITSQFDKKISELHKQGLNYQQIAKQLGGSYSTVKTIGEGRYGKYHKPTKANPLKVGRKNTDWNIIDQQTLPLVKKIIKQMQGDNNRRPHKISINGINRLLNLPSKQIYLLPKCKALIMENIETQEEYWAKEIVWAFNKLIEENQPINWKHLRDITNMKPKNLQACVSFLYKYGTTEVIESILEIAKSLN